MSTDSIPDNLIQVFDDLFVNSRVKWSKQFITHDGDCGYSYPKPGSPGYWTVGIPLLRKHLEAKFTIALPAVDEPGPNAASKWLLFDSDTDNGDLEKVEQLCHQYGWPTLREAKRPGRAGHAWMFFDEPVPSADLIVIGQRFLEAAGITIECFPKLSDGWSQVRAPLGYHRKPGAECFSWFEDCTEKDTISQLVWLSKQKKIDAATVRTLAAQIRAEAPKPVRRTKRVYSTSGRGKVDFKQVKAHSLVQIKSVLQNWLPGGKRSGKEYKALNPKRRDKHVGSLSINLNTGIWSDFAVNEKGDLIDLVAYLDNLSKLEAAKSLSAFLNVR